MLIILFKNSMCWKLGLYNNVNKKIILLKKLMLV